MTKEFNLKMVSMPNFIIVEAAPRPRQEGLVPNPSIPVEELSEKEANEYAEGMKQAFIDHWKSKQNNQSK